MLWRARAIRFLDLERRNDELAQQLEPLRPDEDHVRADVAELEKLRSANSKSKEVIQHLQGELEIANKNRRLV